MRTDERDSPPRAPLRGVDSALLARYDRPGPRYTSYPTAVEFDDGVDAELYERLLGEAAARVDEPLSIYAHLPFCAEQCLFCACHVVITPHYDRALPYLELIEKETEMVAERLGDRRTVSQLHLGGGTPTYYAPEDLARWLDRLWCLFTRTDDAEVAVEIDPRVTRREHLDVLAERGFNRVSMGVQDFTPIVQKTIHREQSRESTESLLEHARDLGFRGLNVDLVYGLPHQTPETFGATVDAVIEMEVDRVAVYSFAFVPWMKGHQRKLQEEDLPTRETKFDLFALAREKFLEAGYLPIGMDHFARADDELARARERHDLRRNFQGYSVIPAPDVIGLGVSAIGDVAGAYVQNVKKLSEYQDALQQGRLPVERGVVREFDDELRRAVIHELMCNFRIDVADIEAAFDVEFHDYFRRDLELLEPHVDEGMVEIGDEVIEATPLGELFVRNLAMCFDRYRRAKSDDRPVFSRTV